MPVRGACCHSGCCGEGCPSNLHICAFVIVSFCIFILFPFHFPGVDSRASSSASMAADTFPPGNSDEYQRVVSKKRQTLTALTGQCDEAQARLDTVLAELEEASTRLALERSRYDALREFLLSFSSSF
jgi:hypothetical protein